MTESAQAFEGVVGRQSGLNLVGPIIQRPQCASWHERNNRVGWLVRYRVPEDRQCRRSFFAQNEIHGF